MLDEIGLPELTEEKELDVRAAAELLAGWWMNHPEANFLNVILISESGRSFKRNLPKKEAFNDVGKADLFLQNCLATATKFFGRIVTIQIHEDNVLMAPPSFKRMGPLPKKIDPLLTSPRINRFFSPNYDQVRVEKHKKYNPNFFLQLPKRPVNLKIHLLDKIRTQKRVGSNLKLRDAQSSSLDKIEEFLAEESNKMRGYVVLPTGAGKTLMYGLLLKILDEPALILVPDNNLLLQIKEELVSSLRFDSEEIGLLDKSHREFGRKFTFATYSMHNALKRMKNPNYSRQLSSICVNICDEAHDAVGEKTSERIGLVNDEKEDECFILGVTATPQLNGKHIRDYFDREIFSSKFSEQVNQGILVPLKLIEIGAKLYSKEVNSGIINEKNENNIVNREQLFERTLSEYEQLRNQVLKEEGKLITAVYVNRIDQAYRYQQMAAEKGYRSAVVVSSKKNESAEEQRRNITEIEKKLVGSELEMVIAVGKLAQGWDFKPLNCIILASPMTSPKKITQRIGRGTRTFPGKECCYVIAPNYKIIKARSAKTRTVGELEKTTEVRRQRGDQNKLYKLGDEISVWNSLRESGENDADLQRYCPLLKPHETAQNSKLDYSTHRKIMEINADIDSNYFDDYFNNPQRIKIDLENYATQHSLEDIAFLRTRHFNDTAVNLADGQRISGVNYLKIFTTVWFDRNASLAKGLVKIKQILGIEMPELTDKNYYTPARMRADLQLAIKSVREENNFWYFGSSDLYKADEKTLSGALYLQRAQIALSMEEKSKRDVYQRIKEIAAQKEEVVISRPQIVENIPGPDPEPALVVLAEISDAVETVMEEIEPVLEENISTGTVLAGEKVISLERTRRDLSIKNIKADFVNFKKRYGVVLGKVNLDTMAEWKFIAAGLGEVTLAAYLKTFEKLLEEKFEYKLNESEILGILKRVVLVGPILMDNKKRLLDEVYISQYTGREVFLDMKAAAFALGLNDFRRMEPNMFGEKRFVCCNGRINSLENYLNLNTRILDLPTKEEMFEWLIAIAEAYCGRV